MKNKMILTVFMAVMAITGLAQTQKKTGDFIYVYHKDGQVDAFYRSEVQEFYYDFEDANGEIQDDIAMQWIVMEDSIYKVPLEEIDSVSFVTPPTVLKAGVTDLQPTLAQYAVGSDELTLYLSDSTPESLLPAVGTRVVLAERSFAGDVASVTREDSLIIVRATMVDLEEIFDTYYAVRIFDFVQDEASEKPKMQARRADLDINTTIKLQPVGLFINDEIINFFLPGDSTELGVTTSFTALVKPTFTVKASLVINEGKRAHANIVGDFDCQEQFKFNGKAEFSHDFYNKTKDVVEQPLGETFFFLYNRWGLVFKAAAELDISMEWEQRFRATLDWSYNSKAEEQKKPVATFERVSADYNPEGTLKGSMSFGPFTELGIKFVTTELAKAALRAEGALELVGEFVLNNKTVEQASGETKLYEALKDSKVELNLAGNTSLQFSFLTTEQGVDLPLAGNLNLLRWHLVPEFQNTLLEQKYGAPTSATGSVGMTKRNLIIPVEVGLKLYDKDGIPVSEWKSPNKYSKGARTIEHQFDGLDAEDMYKLRPTVKLLFWEMDANPDAPILRNPFPVRIVSFEQTGSAYSEQQGYEFDGRNYYFKFNATTTVELSEYARDVEDWGYVYHDIYGEDKRISCAELGGKRYPDERWAYYYNDTRRSVELFPYVKYKNDDTYYYGRHDTWWVNHEFPFPVSIVNFKQTKQEYDLWRYFSYEGKRYYYKFCATTTVELSKEATNVEDWGYVYHDIYGEDKVISCADQGSNPYDDARYAYYYNDAERTVELRPYVKYCGDDNYYYGPYQTWTLAFQSCPDENHPHAIDLALKSGTKWSCCDLGSTRPEKKGDRYAWGETETKDEFKETNYQWIKEGDFMYVDIGNDIAGTSCDAARAQWGDSWQMPSLGDWGELEYCDVRWVIKNGVAGRRYIGYNGKSIFVPSSSPYDPNGNSYYDRMYGYYWTSTRFESNSNCAYYRYFYTGGAGNYSSSYTGREFGLRIRPVSK